MADQPIPGFTPDPPASGAAPIPGFTPDSDAAQTSASTQPASLGSKVWEGAKESQIGQVTQGAANVIKGPQTPTEQLLHAVVGAPGLAAYRAAKALVGSAEGVVKAQAQEYPQAVQDFQRTVSDFHKGDWRNAASSAVSTAADASALLLPETTQSANQVRELSEGARPGGNLATPLTRDALDVATMGAGAKVGEVLGDTSAPKTTTSTTAAPKTPGLIEQVVKGEDVAQAPAQAALRKNPWASARASARASGSLRTVVDEPITKLDAAADAKYAFVDKTTGVDIKGLNARLDKINKNIRMTADPDVEARLELRRTQTMDELAEARKTLVDKLGPAGDGILREADQLYKRARAGEDVRDAIYHNQNVIKGDSAAGDTESVNVSAAIKELQKLQDNVDYGSPRLEQFFGKDGAKTLLNDLRASERAGVKAMSRQQFAKKLALYIGAPLAAGALGAEAYNVAH